MLKFAYLLKTLDGEVIDITSREDPLVFVDGADRFIPGLEAVLRSMKPGERRTVTLPPQQAYGDHDPSLIQAVPRGQLPPLDFAPGEVFRTGEDVHDPIVTIVSADDTEVVLDGNHPLAGMTLVFELETLV